MGDLKEEMFQINKAIHQLTIDPSTSFEDLKLSYESKEPKREFKIQNKLCIETLHGLKILLDNPEIQTCKLVGKALATIENYAAYTGIKNDEEITDLLDSRLKVLEEKLELILGVYGSYDFLKATAPLARVSHSAKNSSYHLAEKLLDPILTDDKFYKKSYDAYLLFQSTIKLYDKSPQPQGRPNLFMLSAEKSFESITEKKDNKKLFDVLVGKSFELTKGGKAESFVIDKIIKTGKKRVALASDDYKRNEVIDEISENYKILSRIPFKNGVKFLDSMASIAMLQKTGSKAENTVIDGMIRSSEIIFMRSQQKFSEIDNTFDKVVSSSTISNKNKRRVEGLKISFSKYHTLSEYSTEFLESDKGSDERKMWADNISGVTIQVISASKETNSHQFFLLNMQNMFRSMIKDAEGKNNIDAKSTPDVKILKSVKAIVDKNFKLS